MSRRFPFLVASLLVLVLVVSACSGSGQQNTAPGTPAKNADGYTDISVEQLRSMMADKDFTLVNVHIPYEGNLPQTDLSIPYNTIDQNLDELPGKDEPIVLYCRSGSMSTAAAETLVDLGYNNVLELDGGFNAWKAAGNQFINP